MPREQFVLTMVFFVAVIPTALGIFYAMFRQWLKLKEKQLDRAALAAAEKAAAQTAHIDKLEQRMRVLERIATDQGAALAAEIEGLPPCPPVRPNQPARIRS